MAQPFSRRNIRTILTLGGAVLLLAVPRMGTAQDGSQSAKSTGAGDVAPVVGIWRQVGEILCSAPDVVVEPADPIRELRLQADGLFNVTWLPFEIYVDYWGAYHFDPANGNLRLEVDRGNFVPAKLVLNGQAEVLETGMLHLSGIFLGSRSDEIEPGLYCGSRWRREG